MIRELLFGGRALALTQRGLDAGAARQRTISENVAQVSTPGYQARRVEFEELITEARAAIPLDRTDPAHISPAPDEQPKMRVVTTRSPVPEGAVNNVDVEQEMVLLKQNEVHYNALSQLLARKYKGIEGAIR